MANAVLIRVASKLLLAALQLDNRSHFQDNRHHEDRSLFSVDACSLLALCK